MSIHTFGQQSGSSDVEECETARVGPTTFALYTNPRKESWGGGETGTLFGLRQAPRKEASDDGDANTGTTCGLSQAPRKKRFRPEIFPTSMTESCTSDLEYVGVNGYRYSIRYSAGYVTLAVYTSVAVELSGKAKTACTISVKDWSLFREVVCPDLENPGLPELVYVCQWDSSIGPSVYRVEADRFTRPTEDFIFLSVCSEREKLVAARGPEEWKLKPYPVSNEEYNKWFKNVFFIQWCDWEILKKQFDTIDYVIRRDKIRSSYENMRKRLIFGDADQQSLPLPRTLYRPKIVRHKD